MPREPNATETALGLTLTNKQVRNRIVNEALQFALQSNPSAVYNKSFAQRITTGNFEDDLQLLKECDWIIEAVIERLDIKQSIYEKIETVRKPGP